MNFNFFKKILKDLIDDEEMENIDNDKEDCVNIKLGYISESDAENDIMVMKQSKKELEKVQHPKNFTSKIMSFIKKLRNENLLAHNDENEHADEAEEDEEGTDQFLINRLTLKLKSLTKNKKEIMTLNMTALTNVSVTMTIVTRIIQMPISIQLFQRLNQSLNLILKTTVIQTFVV